MRLLSFQRVWMRGVRNLSEGVFDYIDANPVVILGPNNQGKTNFLEVLHLILTGKSPVESGLDKVISFDHPEMVMVADVLKGDEKVRFSFKWTREGLRVGLKDSVLLRSYSSVVSDFPVLFLSSDLFYTFRESPQARRQNLDRFCENYFSDYSEISRKYRRILSQKNELLKENKDRTEISFWNEQLVICAADLVRRRHEALAILEQYYHQMSCEFEPSYFSDLRFSYVVSGGEILQSDMDYITFLNEKIQLGFEKELASGYALYGPHREDYLIEINGRNLFSFFSRGVNKLVSFCLSLAQIEAIFREKGSYPILLLDDPFAEMDALFKKRAIALVQERAQVFYTTVIEEDVALFKSAQVFRMAEGLLQRG